MARTRLECWEGEVFAYVGSIQNLKDLKVVSKILSFAQKDKKLNLRDPTVDLCLESCDGSWGEGGGGASGARDKKVACR